MGCGRKDGSGGVGWMGLIKGRSGRYCRPILVCGNLHYDSELRGNRGGHSSESKGLYKDVAGPCQAKQSKEEVADAHED